MCSLLHQQASLNPERIAIIDREKQITFNHLKERANAVSGELAFRGLTTGDLVGVCMDRSWELVASLWGVLKAGCAYVPLDPAYPHERVRYMMRHSKARAVIVDGEATAELCDEVSEQLWLKDIGANTFDNVVEPAADDLAYVIYTSGSTGEPKGVAIEHRNVVAMIQAMADLVDEKDLDGVLAATSVCFDPSVMEILGTLSLGGTVVMAKNMLDLPQLDSAKQVKSCVVVPSAIQALISTGWVPESIRTIIFGSEALKLPLVEKLFSLKPDIRIFNAYGSTEDTVFSTSIKIEEGIQAVTIGKSVPNSSSYILDEAMNLVPQGEPGELYLAGNKLARGYLYDEPRTQKRFISTENYQHISAKRIYKTGDLCRKLANGEIEFLGRVDQQVKIRGFRVELEEIETALENFTGIDLAAAVAVEGGAGQNMLVAYIVSKDKSITDVDVKTFLSQRMPKYMIPQKVVRLNELPLLPNGKLDRNKLSSIKNEGVEAINAEVSENDYKGNQNSLNNQKSAIFSIIQKETVALLNITDAHLVTENQSFDSLGIDSLTTFELSSRLSKALNLRLPATIVLEHATPADLVDYILSQKGITQEFQHKNNNTKAPDSLTDFQANIRSSHPTFQAAKVSAWSATDKGKLVQEVLRMVNDQRRNPYSKVLKTGSATRGLVSDAYNDEEKEAIIWTTNLYLGLNRDKEVISAASKALHSFGTGMGTSAAASGMTDLHLEFEQEFAELTGKPSACLFPTGYTANVGAVAGILGRNDVVIIDQLFHASIVDGARLCGATIRTFQHNNASDLEAVIKSEVSPYRSVMVVLEGVYSMGEGAAPVADIVRVAKKYGALVLVDEAHSFGFYGKDGAGICAAQGITEQVDFIMTTLSKAMGSIGGVVAASQEHVDLIKSSSRAYIFQASVSPADMAAALTSLRRLRSDSALRDRLWDTTRYMRKRFEAAGYDLGTGDGPIVTPHFSDKDKLYAIVQEMYKRGVQTSAVTYPIVESGRGRLRFICSAAHTKEDVDFTLQALIEAEHEVDLQLAQKEPIALDGSDGTENLKEWGNSFSNYVKDWINNHLKLIPNLAVSVNYKDESVSILLKDNEVLVTNQRNEDIPHCTLNLKDQNALTSLSNSDVQDLLQSISNGNCELKGQVEPFVWFIARLVEHKNNMSILCAQEELSYAGCN
ncbi:amino acid adenylation domain-containing protein [Fulvivirga maritima]|uniref:amino acid adenylation domain-containing protein n=1 Tax=Fulvivirga maritima TaxID=2904247 RepID=UPI001F319672|nr:amino acid adenylation domain-containing protein [Fulvivirga maritima]UII29530.1 amino acid adenylation domain-containing protein [Fulvivirga maritima]